ncbi:phosphonate C-P lyase system protein PhnH [Mycolicibacterium tokaiense]|uniref:Carbon-phosphorus lyase complex subunit n=1 Tax=Mycolicibacterium tokaiense TaxID=39695 RepID=A0A378THV7_9MYCO|nr:phosphonate C-P lyase system protein PhnH [Mycolicibacterium tokaiense]BBY85739.1 carbon-phosphorus lyase subunit PhnH [Mycolicibacterium tokaiense]STZ59747.1 carbon-phosphorus lyase complex subunit [Mycolicibacterium tokaiense]
MTWDPVHDSRSTFLACMHALCSPGTPFELPQTPDMTDRPELDRAAAVLLALLDRGLGLAIHGGDAAAQVAAAARTATGADSTDLGAADWVLVDGPPAPAIVHARRGTPTNPESSATLVIASTGPTRPVRLAGPGLREPVTHRIPLDELAQQALVVANQNPPMGLDIFIVTPDCLIGLPRSVSLQAVA